MSLAHTTSVDDSKKLRFATSHNQEEEVVIRIVRHQGTGLGISIAGGRGSTPYKKSDEVFWLIFLCFMFFLDELFNLRGKK